ncbi:hypothetical protein ACRALDRAFT_207057 [Sodiomyces alcalophilus JCM 7366]|uniref:uncharacterized protein n=1 Tax=Sodiomyces alcalophilus JCM 7366 TaxID=591952 RepID=UPI0039B41891
MVFFLLSSLRLDIEEECEPRDRLDNLLGDEASKFRGRPRWKIWHLPVLIAWSPIPSKSLSKHGLSNSFRGCSRVGGMWRFELPRQGKNYTEGTKGTSLDPASKPSHPKKAPRPQIILTPPLTTLMLAIPVVCKFPGQPAPKSSCAPVPESSWKGDDNNRENLGSSASMPSLQNSASRQPPRFLLLVCCIAIVPYLGYAASCSVSVVIQHLTGTTAGIGQQTADLTSRDRLGMGVRLRNSNHLSPHAAGDQRHVAL